VLVQGARAHLVLAGQRTLRALSLAAQLLHGATVLADVDLQSAAVAVSTLWSSVRSIRPAAAGAVPCYRECRCPKHGMGPWRRRDTFLGHASFGSHHAEVKPTLYLRLTSFMKYSITRWSKSSPPRWVSPDVDTTCACGKGLLSITP